MTSEASIIERILRGLPSRGRGLRVGIGDDAAVIAPPPRGREVVLTSDMFLEGIHFLAGAHPPDAVGYKALARATSDLAAMGVRPRFFLLSLAVPENRAGKWLDGVIHGMSRAARRFGLVLAGGDTAKLDRVAMSIAVFGEVRRGGEVTRAGARPGDLIYASGRLGAAQLGLELVLHGMHSQKRWREFVKPHHYPPLRLDLGLWLARPQPGAPRGVASAMIDTSDGLSTDLGHICDASGVGAKIWAERIPAVRVPTALSRRLRGVNAREMALHGGEDYELLFTVPSMLAKIVPSTFRGTPIACIGEITRTRPVLLVERDSTSRRLEPKGWDHFR